MPERTFDEVKASLLAAIAQGDDAAFQMGVDYNEIVDRDLAKGTTYGTSAKFFQAVTSTRIATATLKADGRVARSFTRDIVKKYGSSKLARFLDYVSQAHLPTPPADPGQVQVNVPGKDGATSPKALADCTFRDLVAAVVTTHVSNHPLSQDEQATLASLIDVLTHLAGADAKHAPTATVSGEELVLKLPRGAAPALLAMLQGH